MENPAEFSLADQYSAALDWWRDAGVDCDFADEAQSWLEQNALAQSSLAGQERARLSIATPQRGDPQPDMAPAPAPPAMSASDVPDDLPVFQDWWTSDAFPLPTGPNRRVAPRGEVGAPLMLIAPMPESDDGETLLSGPQGRLLGNLAKALGYDPAALYFASALPSHITMPDWAMLHREGIGHALARHIALARPQRVIVLGSKLPMLLGHAGSAPPEGFTAFGGTPALTTFAPDRLLKHARQRARLWQRLLAWTAS